MKCGIKSFVTWRSVTALLLLAVIPLLCSCSSSRQRIFKVTRTSMYTVVSMSVVTSSETQANEAIDAAFDELDRLARLLNFYSPTSEISEINREAGVEPVKVSPDTLDIMQKAVYISKMTDGAFDVTVGPLVKLWDLKKKIIPPKKAIEEKLRIVGYKNIVIDPAASTVYLKLKGAQIDLGGIIKGYAVDHAVAVLHRHHIYAGVVAVGGEIRTMGTKPDGKPWMIGIQNPRQKGENDKIVATIDLTDKAFSTSGDYIRYFIKNGVRYHHLLDPKTGYPSRQCGSTTVIADDNTTADGFADMFILGPKRGLAVARKLGFDILYIDCNGKVEMSEDLKNKVNFIH